MMEILYDHCVSSWSIIKFLGIYLYSKLLFINYITVLSWDDNASQIFSHFDEQVLAELYNHSVALIIPLVQSIYLLKCANILTIFFG